MTPEDPQDRLSEEEMGTQLSRLAKPFALVAPLVVVVLVPAYLYGQRSQQVASEADRELVASLTTVADGPETVLDPTVLCDPEAVDTLTTTFTEINLDGDNHKSSVRGLGFDAVTVDLKGWVGEPTGAGQDDIIVHMKRSGDGWCVTDVETRVTEAQS